jgi:hypothetical protein
MANVGREIMMMCGEQRPLVPVEHPARDPGDAGRTRRRRTGGGS